MIINYMVKYYKILDFLITNQKFFFIFLFYLLLYYFLDIKQKINISFYLKTYNQIKKKNSRIKVYL